MVCPFISTGHATGEVYHISVGFCVARSTVMGNAKASSCGTSNGTATHAFFVYIITLVTYAFAIIIERRKAFGKRKYLIISGACLSLLPLLIFKYYNFINDNLGLLLNKVGISSNIPGLNWAIPVGISFFSLQAVGYLFDVYYQRIKAERNLINYLLFVSFFPQIAAGPISKASDLLPQIQSVRRFNYCQAVQGLKWILWGTFLKTIVADRIGVSIDSFNTTLHSLSGLMNLSIAVLYSFQIYTDFAGYSFIAVGVGELFGFEFINNFRRPYLSQSITEFWHRWHISLSTWLKDYVYIPLGGNRCSKLRNYLNILVTFLVSGIWHGANWTFVVWGLIHGILQVFEKMVRINKIKSKGLLKAGRICITFSLLTIAWIFFRQPTIGDALSQIAAILTNHDLIINFDSKSVFYILFGVIIVIVKDITDEFNISNLNLLHSKWIVARWLAYIFLASSILMFGVLDNSQFIYVNF